MEVNIYADILFLINFIINLIILKLTSFLMKNPSSVSRMCLASALGAVYAIFMFFPSIEFLYIFPCKILASAIMVKIALPASNYLKLIKNTLVFFAVSFCFAGILIALTFLGAISESSSSFLHNGIFYFDISLWHIMAASAVCALLSIAVCRIFKRNKTLGIKRLRISLSGRVCEMHALSDSGNLLTDPISNIPVVIAEEKSLIRLFPEGIPDITQKDVPDVKLRLIPFSSLGNPDGLMTGFVPDEVCIDGKKTDNVIIAISPGILSEKDEYNALFNPNILV